MSPFSLTAAVLFALLLVYGARAVHIRAQGAVPEPDSKLVMVTTLTRHGSRAPDKILATVSCQPLLPRSHPEERLKDIFIKRFGTIPGELTVFGEDQMEEVGRFMKQRYGQQGLEFVDTENYFHNTRDWEFIARSGSRQQRSMMAIAQGLFPGTSVPISVVPRNTDAVLGGPAPQCGTLTAQMIVEWHGNEGRKLVEEHYEEAVEPFERLCNVSLRDNPVNAKPGGPNPHAWIGDISDLLDSYRENLPVSKQPPYTPESYEALTKLAFALEQKSHYDDPRGRVMFAGEFPERLLSTFEEIEKNEGKRIKGAPKVRMYACSRELEYGLSEMFDWEKNIQLPDQPHGRVLAGSTIIWELWRVNNSVFVDTYMFQPGVEGMLQLQPRTSLSDYRKEYTDAIRDVGAWTDICNVKPLERIIERAESHGTMFWFVLFFLVALGLALAYATGYRRVDYQAL